MNNLQKALNLAIETHKNQVDKGGYPYINHPVYLALQMDTEEEKIVALLHDVVEDDLDIDIDYIEFNFGMVIAYAVQVLTHKEEDSYFEYINIIKNSNNAIAIKVKLADLRHNSDTSRLCFVSNIAKQRIEKYKKSIEILEKCE